MIFTLPYIENTPTLFEQIANKPWSILLDSGHTNDGSTHTVGRYDILACSPLATLVTNNQNTTITDCRTNKTRISTDDPFDLLRTVLNQYREDIPDTIRQRIHLPFVGGAMGYFSYDLGRRIENLPAIALDAEDLPEMAVAIFDSVLIVDHYKKVSYLSAPSDQKTAQQHLEQWQLWVQQYESTSSTNQLTLQPFNVTSKVKSNLSFKQYSQAFDKIKTYINAGDCYQVNLTQRFSASATGDLWTSYKALKKINPAPFSAYFNTPFGQILSSSPERFLSVENRKVSTKPIKGTRPRSANKTKDKAFIKALQNSEKDRAENVMIVDLLRNDLGRVCKIGSVKVPTLFEIESYATVHHLVSTVTGELAKNEDAISLLRASFPGGSITGAPKIRAMEIIEEIEPHRRGIYCGALGYIDFNGNMDTNIMIRSLIYNNGEVRFWVGGGIVYDSDVKEEYQETYDKGAALLQLLDQFSTES